MKNRKMLLPALLSIALVFSLILPASVVGASATVLRPDDRSISHLWVDSSSPASAMNLNTPSGKVTPMVAAGGSHTVGLKSDSTVIAVGLNDDGQCDVGGWTDIVQVAAGYKHTVGLKSDSTVIAVGLNDDGQCDVGGWTDIAQVASGYKHTVGIEKDGTVVAVGSNGYGQCNVDAWTDIIQVAAGYYHTVGLKADGIVVAVGQSGAYSGVGGWTNIIQVAAGDWYTVGLKSDGTVVAVGADILGGQCSVGGWTDIVQIAAGSSTVGLKSDGTVAALTTEDFDQCEVSGWTDIIRVAAGHYHTVGLKDDRTVVAVGWNGYGQCNVGGWTDIIQVAAGRWHTVGLKSDGTVVAVGLSSYGICNVGDWTNIAEVAAGFDHTVGLKSDGTVVAVGSNGYGQCDVGGWTDITRVAAGLYHTVGLKSGGAVVAVGWNDDGQCDVGGWTDITRVAAGGSSHTVGLKSDGTVVAVGNNNSGQCDVGGWTDIVQVAAGWKHTVGIRTDGTVVAVGRNDYGQCDVGDWTDIAQVSAGDYHMVGVKPDGTAVAVGPGSEFPKWNLGVIQYDLTISNTAGGSVTTPSEGVFTYDAGTIVDLVAEPEEGYRFVRWTGDVDTIGNVNSAATTITMHGDYSITANFAIPPVKYNLTISGTAGGSVTVPGEGTFIYDEGTVVNLVAEPEAGYRFVNWAGDMDTIADITSSTTNITMQGDYSVTANLVSVEAGNVSIKAGDWIKYEYKITGWPAGQPYPEWLKLEFLSVEGTSANAQVTLHISDGTEQNATMPVNVVAGGDVPGLSGGIISANLTTGDSVYMSGFGNVTIKGETTRTYAGARRTVVYTSISQSVPYQGEVQLSYYWDKLTGVIVEASTTYGDITATCKATETNMWEAGPPGVGMAWWLWLIVAVAIVALAIVVYRLKKRKTPTAPTLPTEGT